MRVLGILALIAIWSGFWALRCEATVWHSDGSAASVQDLQNIAVNGDTITLPAGMFTWSTPVTISKAIKLQGSGSGRIIGNTKSSLAIGTGIKTFTTTRSGLPITVGQVLRIAKMPGNGQGRYNYMQGTVASYSGTTLVMNITNTGGSGTWTFWWIGTADTTKILNNYNNGAGDNSAAAPLIRISQTQAGSAELAGIHFEDTPSSNSSTVGLNTSAYYVPKTLIHDCWFSTGYGAILPGIFAATNQGVVWNCSFDSNSLQIGPALRFSWNSPIGAFSWASNSTMGADDINGATNFYVEDCDFHVTGTDFEDNSRVVFRHNVLDNASPNSHGADSGRYGMRHAELYDNEFIFDAFQGNCSTEIPLQQFYWQRGGTGVITDNILPRISSQCEGVKNNITFSVLNTRRSVGPYCCWTTYPAPHQIGQGYGAGAVFHGFLGCGSYGWANYYTHAEPVYIWNNTGTAGNLVELDQDRSDECGHGQQVANYVQAGRDYIVGAKPGYVKFTYPHPLVTRGARAEVADLNGDGSPDFVIQNPRTHQTAMWYLDNNVLIGNDSGPTLPNNWELRALADFDADSHTDYALFHPFTGYTAIEYMSGPTIVGGAWGPALPNGWELVGTADFNGDGKPDYVLFNRGTRRTAIWYLANNVLINGDVGPTLPIGWDLIGVADFDRDGHPDYVLFHRTTGITAIWYLSGPTIVSGALGPTIPSDWILVATADFNGDGHPDYLLYNAGTRQTAIWYLNNTTHIGSADGPTLPAWWSLIAPR